MGVACQLYCKNVKNIQTIRGKYADENAYLPDEVRDWLGLVSDCGAYENGDSLHSLQSDNDHHGKNFKQIADIIESKPEGLFKKGK